MGAILGAATPAQAAVAPAAAEAPAASLREQVRDAFTAGAIAPERQGMSAIICDPL